MRIFMIDPKLLCDDHLLLEHDNLHLVVDAINNKEALDEYFWPTPHIQFMGLADHHKEVTDEISKRNFDTDESCEGLPKIPSMRKLKRLYPRTYHREVIFAVSSLDLRLMCRNCF